MTTLQDLYHEVFGQPSVRQQLDTPTPARAPRRPAPSWNPGPRPWEVLGQQQAPIDKPADGDPMARYHAPRVNPEDLPRNMQTGAMGFERPTQQQADRFERYGPGATLAMETGEGALEISGLPQVRRSSEGFTRGIMSGSPDMEAGWGQGWSNLGQAALNVGGTAGVVGDVAALGQAGRQFRFAGTRPPPRFEEPVTRLPVNPTREIGQNGLPIRPPEPFRNSLRGSNDDLAEAAGMRRSGDDAGGSRPMPLEGEVMPPSRDLTLPQRASEVELSPEAMRLAAHIERNRRSFENLGRGLNRMADMAGDRADEIRAGLGDAPHIRPLNDERSAYGLFDARNGELLSEYPTLSEASDAWMTLHREIEANRRYISKNGPPQIAPPTRTAGAESTPPARGESVASEAARGGSAGGSARGVFVMDEHPNAPNDGVLRLTTNPDGGYQAQIGTIEFERTPQGLRIVNTVVKPEYRNQQQGVALYEELVRRADAEGLPVIADRNVSPDARRVYDALERRGYQVARDAEGKPTAVRPPAQPLRLYRGVTRGDTSGGAYWTKDPRYASRHAMGQGEEGAAVMHGDAQFERPYYTQNKRESDLVEIPEQGGGYEWMESLRRQGYDAIIDDIGNQVYVLDNSRVRPPRATPTGRPPRPPPPRRPDR